MARNMVELAAMLAQREAELAVIGSVQEALAAKRDLADIYTLVGDQIRDLFASPAAGIYTFDLLTGTEHFQYLFEDGERVYPKPRPLNDLRKWLIAHKSILHVNENAQDEVLRITGTPMTSVPGTRLPKSLLFVPMVVGNEVKGCVSLQNLDEENAYSESDVRLLSTLVNSMNVALESAHNFSESVRLLAETEQRNAELAVINSVQRGLADQMDLQAIYDLVGEKIRDLFDAQVVAVATFDHEQQSEIFKYLFEEGKRHYPSPRSLDKIRLRLIKTQKMILINENSSEAFTTITGEAPKSVPGTEFPKSMIFVPLSIGSHVRGYVSLQNLDKENAFSESDVRLLNTLANSMSVALENARLFNETEQRNAELAVINSVQDGLVAEMDMQGIYDLVGERIRTLFDSQVTGIISFVHDEKKEHFNYYYEDGDRLFPSDRFYDNLRQKLIDERTTLLFNENTTEIVSKINGQPFKAIPGTRVPQSVLLVPMIAGDQVRGYVTLQNLDREHAFSESDVRLLSMLTNSMSVALENARLFNETEQRNAELAVINSVQDGLVAAMDMKGIYDLVGERIRGLFDAQVTGIYTFDQARGLEIFQYLFEDGERLYPDHRPLNAIRYWLIKNKTILNITEDADEGVFQITGERHLPVPGTRLPKSLVFVPLIVNDEVQGCVSLQNLDRENAFSDSDVRLLNTLATTMSVALENARLFSETTRLLAETEQRNAELAVINSVQDGLVREMDMQAIYDLVGERICDVLNTQTMIIRTFDHRTGLEHWQYAVEKGVRIEVNPRPLIWANKILVETKDFLLINEKYEEIAIRAQGTAITKGLAPKSAIFVPMIVGDVVVGSVSLQNVEREHAFSESDVRLITTLTNSMSVALENARLFDETNRLLRETNQRASELDTVNRVSNALVAQLEFDALVKLVGDMMRETFNADIVYLAMHDRETNWIHFPYYHGDVSQSRAFGNGITEKIITTKQAILVNEDLDAAYKTLNAEKRGKSVASFLGVPILAGEDAIGVISIQSTEMENRFGDSDKRLLNTIAANVGVALENAEAYKKLHSALNELKAAQEQLVQQEKLASLGQLTAGIAHEIKNPLNFVNNFASVSLELIEEARQDVIGFQFSANGEDSQQTTENRQLKTRLEETLSDIGLNLKKIHEHGTRADKIVKGMLMHSRGKSGDIQKTSINGLVDEYVNLAYHGMRATDPSFSVDIKTELDPAVGDLNVVPQDLSRAILNIVNNACYAVNERKRGKGYSEGVKPTVVVKTKMLKDSVLISIRDNGTGIPDTVRKKIFEPFYTTKPTGEGTGLGLSMTYDIIVHTLGGKLDIETKEGEFTEFLIHLPHAK